MNAIFDLKKTMIVALVALACSTASARPGHNRMHRHHVRPVATVVVKKCGCPLQEAPQACEKSKMLEIKKMRSDKP